jgi:GT2 family glycosyltransferase
MVTTVMPDTQPRVITGREALDRRTADSWPKVTVAILAFNRRDALRVTLAKTLGELEYPGEALDIVVVDNGSSDGTAEMMSAEFPDVRLIRLERNVGISGWNEAFAVAGGEWCLVLDDDCFIEGSALQLAVAAAEANRADLVSFRVRSSEQDYYFTEEYVSGLLSFWGCAALMSRQALEELGGYDPFMFVWSHELEFTMRLLSRGLRHLYLGEVVAVHMKAPTGRHALKRRFRHQAVGSDVGSETDVLLRQHQANYRHWAYAAAKFLRPLDAVRVIGRLTLSVLLDLVAKTPRTARSLPALAGGVIGGVRARQPVRAEVSAAYRDNFVTFANPLRLLRSPGERIAGLIRAGGDPDEDDGRRFDEFRKLRPRYYPADVGILEL